MWKASRSDGFRHIISGFQIRLSEFNISNDDFIEIRNGPLKGINGIACYSKQSLSLFYSNYYILH